MSLEETIAANTAAIGDLIACWKGMARALATGPSTTPVLDIVGHPAVGAESSPTVAQNIAKAAGIAAELAVEATPAAILAPEAGAIATATLSDVLTAASQLIANPAKGKAALKAALTGINVKVTAISEIPKDKIAAALGAIKEAIAA